ncbi:hypothetical protein K0M31_010230, partial [Melipona bicolor]
VPLGPVTSPFCYTVCRYTFLAVVIRDSFVQPKQPLLSSPGCEGSARTTGANGNFESSARTRAIVHEAFAFSVDDQCGRKTDPPESFG